MRLHRQAVEFYPDGGRLTIVTDPVLTGAWEASFDGGVTWVEGESSGDGWRWLIAGPDADDPDTATVLAATASPLGRHTSNPETIIRDDFPRVTLYP